MKTKTNKLKKWYSFNKINEWNSDIDDDNIKHIVNDFITDEFEDNYDPDSFYYNFSYGTKLIDVGFNDNPTIDMKGQLEELAEILIGKLDFNATYKLSELTNKGFQLKRN